MQAAASLRLARRQRGGRFSPPQHISRFMVMGRRGLQTEREPDGDGIHIVHDHLIPNYLLHPRHRRKGLSSRGFRGAEWKGFTESHSASTTPCPFSFQRMYQGGSAVQRVETGSESESESESEVEAEPGGEVAAEVKQMHILHDYLIPHHYTDILEYKCQDPRRPSEETVMTFVGKDGTPVNVGYKTSFLFSSVFGYVEEHMTKGPKDARRKAKKVRNKAMAAYNNAIITSAMYRVEAGIAILSWSYFGNCCIKEEHLHHFYQFANTLFFKPVTDFLQSRGMYPSPPPESRFGLYYHTANIPPRDASKIESGFHISGYVKPSSCFCLEKTDKVNSHCVLQHFAEGNRTKACFAPMQQAPALKVTIPSPSDPKEDVYGDIDCFFRYMEDVMVRSLRRSADSRMRKQGFYRNCMHRDKLLASISPDSLEWCRKQPYRMQVLCRNPKSVSKAMSMMKPEHQKWFFTQNRTPSFFFGFSDSPPHQRPATVIAEYQELIEFLHMLRECERGSDEATWCAFETPASSVMTMSNVLGYNPLDRNFYVVQPSTEAMINLLQSLQDSSISNQNSADPVAGFVHIFEVLPGLSMPSSASTLH